MPSSLLVSAAGLGVSSATVRNILARLEDDGFVQQPHTSAGRIPTDRGYRFYVDLLLESQALDAHRDGGRGAAAARQPAAPLVDSVLSQVSHVVSQASRHVGFALRPAHESAVLRPRRVRPAQRRPACSWSSSRSGGHVIQKVIDIGEPLDADDLRAGGQLPERASSRGLPLHRAREAVLERMHEERMLYDALHGARDAAGLVDLRRSADEQRDSTSTARRRCSAKTSGLTLGTLHALLEMIEEKQRLVRLLNEYIDGPGLTVVIGAEHPDPSLRRSASWPRPTRTAAGTGTIGVIGPTRMRYSRAIAVVDGAAQAVIARAARPQLGTNIHG